MFLFTSSQRVWQSHPAGCVRDCATNSKSMGYSLTATEKATGDTLRRKHESALTYQGRTLNLAQISDMCA